MGVIQGSINNLLTMAGVAARLSSSLEERKENKLLQSKEKRLKEAYTQLTENTLTPKGIGQKEAAELKGQAATDILGELEDIQFELAKRGKGSFEKVIETKSAKKTYNEADFGGGQKDTDTYEQKINKRIAAMKAAEQDMLIKQQELRGGRLR